MKLDRTYLLDGEVVESYTEPDTIRHRDPTPLELKQHKALEKAEAEVERLQSAIRNACALADLADSDCCSYHADAINELKKSVLEGLIRKCEQAEVERLQGFDHIRSIMVFYINREPMGDENIEVDDIVREYLAEGREE